MLALTLIIGIHPTLSMHFCHGDLHSISVFSSFDMIDCGTEDILTVESNNCCGNNANTEYEDLAFNASHQTCCDFQQLELKTSDYQYQERQYTPNHILSFNNPAWVPFSLILSKPSLASLENLNWNYPPKGFTHKSSIDILTSISILRI